jgi:SAM-dependent methyltransferase
LVGLSRDEDRVARHYDDVIFVDELQRLPRECPVEFAVTLRYLQRWVPDASVVAEIGIGGGHYTEFLARRRCFLHLVDVSQRLLDAACARLSAAGLDGRILGISRQSATALRSLVSGNFDAVLLMGPLYHLCTAEARAVAVAEAARILKPGGILLAAGINRLAYLRDQLRKNARDVLARRAFHEQFLCDGLLDPAHAPPIGFAYLTAVAEFRNLFAGRFAELEMLGVESFSNGSQQVLTQLPPEEAEAWLDLIEQTSPTLEALGNSDHFLYIGRRLS